MLRGVIWFGLYVALVLGPAAVAMSVDPIDMPRPRLVEFSVALGLIAFAAVMMQFALVSRLQVSSRPFGTAALVQFHQYIGFVCLALVVAHPLILNARGLPWSTWVLPGSSAVMASGVIAVWAIVLLVITSVFRARLALTYEWWQRAHLLLASAAAVSMLVHVLAVNGYASAMAVRGALIGYAAAFGALALNYRLARPLRLGRHPWEVTTNCDQGASTRTLCVRPVGHHGFRFNPGQFAWLVTGRSPLRAEQHPLSISSSAEQPPDAGLEFAIKALGGWSGDVVPHLVPGTRVWVHGPFGAFTTEGRAGQGFVMVAGGIGIAPIRSMLLTMRDRGDRRHVVLFYAAHDESRLAFRDDLTALHASLTLDVIHVLEVPHENWAGERGLVTADTFRRHLPPQFRRYHFFVCGPPPMMNAVEATLTALGVASAAIDSERFHVV